MKYEEQRQQYNDVLQDVIGKVDSKDIVDILNIGLVCCDNDNLLDKRPFLLTGINPSNNGDVPRDFTFKDAVGRYWTNKKKQFGPLVSDMAYMDLFPIRETHQNNRFEKLFREYNWLRAMFLEITQKAIEELHPRLIVHANRSSLYYWGLSKKGVENPWMGYVFEKIDFNELSDLPFISKNRYERFPMYRIVGIQTDNSRRINFGKVEDTSLNGTIFMEYVMGYRKKEYRELLYNPNEWAQIWSWAKNQLD